MDLEYFSFYDYYYNFSIENYNLYKASEKKYKELVKNNTCWDMLSHTKEENQLYMDLLIEKKHFAVLSIIFHALAVEAWINYFGVRTFGEKKFNSKYESEKDRKSVISKYKDIYKEIKHEDLPNGPYSNLKLLFRLRDKLVHSKTQVVDLKEEDLQKFLDSMNKIYGSRKSNIFSEINKVMKTYHQIIGLFEK